jgi:hypothetical protein
LQLFLYLFENNNGYRLLFYKWIARKNLSLQIFLADRFHWFSITHQNTFVYFSLQGKLASMNITQRYRQFALIIILGTSSLGLKMSQAFAFTFQETGTAKLEFFDGSGTLVGNGNFTYKPFSGSFITSPPQYFSVYQDPNNPFPPYDQGGPLTRVGYVPPAGYAQVTNFSADLFSVGVRIGPFRTNLNTGDSIVDRFVYLWQPPDAETFSGGAADTLLSLTGGGGRRPSGVSPRNNWFGCLPACGTSQRDLYTIDSNGTWSFYGLPTSGNASGINIGGTWRAAAIPEPGTLAGSAMAVVVLWGFKQRHSSKRLKH